MSQLRRLPASFEEEVLDQAGFMSRQPTCMSFWIEVGLVAVKLGRPSQAHDVVGLQTQAHAQ